MLKKIATTSLLLLLSFSVNPNSFASTVSAQGNSSIKESVKDGNNNSTSTNNGVGAETSSESSSSNNSNNDHVAPNSHASNNANSAVSDTEDSEVVDVSNSDTVNNSSGGGGKSKRSSDNVPSDTSSSVTSVEVTSKTSGIKSKLERSLSVGVSGDDVKRLQEFLNSDPATEIVSSGIGSKGNETGYYGPMTAEAVGKFQIKHGIVSDSNDAGYGVVGPRTMAMIDDNFIYRIGNTPNVLSDEQRRKIIERLRAIVEQVTLMQQRLKEQSGVDSN